MSSEAETQPALAVGSTLHALAAQAATLAAGPAPASGGGKAPSTRYTTRAPLGEGGMGVVYQAWDDDLMRDIAIKQLRAVRRDRPEHLQQFLWEARVTAHLDHPNIVPIHELGLAEDDQLYFTMKYVAGRSLEQVLESLRAGDGDVAARLTPQRRLRLFLQLCQAIAFAHGRGVLHRDLKPANVMLGEHGEVLVMDWGIAVPLPSEAGRHLATLLPDGVEPDPGRISGTPLYMSPEQARGEALDARSDVYTLGAILYELASLRRPYEAESVPELVLKVSEGAFSPFPGSSSLRAVVHRAMARDPADRYETVVALSEDVEAVLDGATPSAEETTALRRLGRFYLRDRNPHIQRMRAIDVDLLALGSGLLGAGLALLTHEWLARLWWAVLVAAALVFVYPIASWVRDRRAGGASSP